MTATAPPVTVVAPPATVYVAPPTTVTVPEAPVSPRTTCQWLRANDYSYDLAYDAWVRAGRPIDWDADQDGYPCEQSYGDLN